MSYSSYSYVGAYIKMPQVEKVFMSSVRRCTNINCENHKKENMATDAKFCMKCGQAIEQIDIEKRQIAVLNYYSFAEENDLDCDKFTQVQNNYNILIPNYKFGAIKTWDGSNEIVVDVKLEDMLTATQEYKENVQTFIDKVKEVYNIELEVKFGIVSYTM